MKKFIFMMLCAVSMLFYSVVPSYAAPPPDTPTATQQALEEKIVKTIETPVQKTLDSVNATNTFKAVKDGADTQATATIDGAKLVRDISQALLPTVQAEINKAAQNSENPYIKWITTAIGLIVGFVFSKASNDDDNYRKQVN